MPTQKKKKKKRGHPPPGGLVAAEGKKFQSTSLQARGCSLWRTLRLCVAGHSECIELLVQHGADVDQRIDRTGSPLHAACSNQHPAAARKLLQLGEEDADAG